MTSLALTAAGDSGTPPPWTDFRAQFRDHMFARGIVPPDSITADGKLHRFSTNAKHADDAGWYVFHGDGIPAGAFGDWRSVQSETWRAEIGRDLTPSETAAHRARVESMREQRKKEDSLGKIEARARANEIWDSAAPAPEGHPYLVRKAIKPNGVRCNGQALIVPVNDGPDLHSLQFIDNDGDKRFLAGGRVSGCYFLIGNPTDTLCVAEGYATGASIHQATSYAVAVAFNAGNLLPVTRTLRERFPTAKMIVCGDDDSRTPGNPGLTKAREAAAAIDGFVAIPDFGADRPASATDFNDLQLHAGVEAVLNCINSATQVPAPATPAATATATATAATTATPWPEPQPFDHNTAASAPYPIGALPGAIGTAVQEYLAYGQQPQALIASSALAAVSLAVQGLADIARDERLRGPISLNFLTIAQSGERKTAADRALSRALADWERQKADELSGPIKRSEAEQYGWAAQQEGYLVAIKRAVIAKKKEEVDRLQQALIEHEERRPTKVVAPRLRYEDVNPQSLTYMLANGHPSAALWSDEGGMVTGSHGMGKDAFLGFLAMMNRLWDGGEIHHDRKQAESVHVEGRRLTASLMVQPSVLSELLLRGGGLSRGSGFLARFLVSAPQSTMGQRLYKDPPRGMPGLETFNRRIRELLDRPLPLDEKGRLCLEPLKLSTGAFFLWREYHDEIEKALVPHGDYATACDFAAKSAENAARIAGCLHLFNGALDGVVTEGTMARAVVLARWYLQEALRLLHVLDEPQAMTDARSLDGWLARTGSASLRDVLRLGPNQLRDKSRRDGAIKVLIELGRARVERDGNRETLVQNPELHVNKGS